MIQRCCIEKLTMRATSPEKIKLYRIVASCIGNYSLIKGVVLWPFDMLFLGQEWVFGCCFLLSKWEVFGCCLLAKIWVVTIQQPRIDIFEAFDELFLLKNRGQVIYNGPLGRKSSRVIEYFEVSGHHY